MIQINYIQTYQTIGTISQWGKKNVKFLFVF